MSDILKKEPQTRFRASVARGAPERVSRKGGMFKAGVIRQASIIMRGDALGHGAFVDKIMLQQVADGVKAAGSAGVKARFTHPGMSSDGMGKYLGKFKNAKLEDDKVLADIHFAQSAHDTPDGDLASYVMNLAEETPEDFGVSIVFERDFKAEREFFENNRQETVDDEGNKRLKFMSPDKKNAKNYSHVRVKRLRAADVVDSPAANEDGLFSEENVAVQAASMISYALGITEDEPEGSLFNDNVHPSRIKGFVARWMESEGLELREVERGRRVESEELKTEMDKTTQGKTGEDSKKETPASEPSKAPQTPASNQAYGDQRQVSDKEFSEFEAWKKKQADEEFNKKVDERVEEKLKAFGVKRSGESAASTTGGDGNKDEPEPATPYAELYKAEVEDKRGSDRNENLRLAQTFSKKYGSEKEYNQKHNLNK